MVIRLDGEVAIVTGAARGIGRGVALAMAEAGASVALCDWNGEGLRDVGEQIRALGAQVTTHELDVSDHDAVAAAVSEAAATLGDATILVTAAAIEETVELEEIAPDAWRRMIEINLHGTFYCLRAVIAGMRRRGRGRIILFGSNLGLKGAAENAHYATAKAGIHSLARCAAIDLADAGITVNAVAPGPVETDMLAGMPADWLDAKRKELLTRSFGTVEQIVPTVILLASDAGAFYTGTTLNISGGDVLQ
jgi:3-oxoacyl-[acyl-carrier protein] reductase